ncbi:DNA-processing protein DprA [Pseudovibrio sp. Tun.PSC04-5.I4]|uniref:DNA-processing protein DprA n=1 Tax=Pseudovibrio sp. Tun.PSC04-5.I4 TaxID=1798213 RepID=UPI00087F903B|nr:DNA-processing protein DprA [Pseudovibrio sp. Tun.PSC04-5.I4]SDR39442.1 DNA processing protein [Pseudovibrio sp. Tun.PSC04-5.I4]
MGTAIASRAPHLSDTQRLAWLRLIRSENVGPRTFRELINHFGSAEAALTALPELSRRGGKKSYRLYSKDKAEAELAALYKMGARLIALGERAYPPLLRHIDAPPPLLAIRARDPLQQELTGAQKTLAIIGARNCSAAGAKFAGSLAKDLSAEGFTIISGLARGIDSAAHQAALHSGTIAAFAGGIDTIYPKENTGLFGRMVAANGAAISEMPIGWNPRARDFPRRNRLISGMSLGVILIEAAEKSGSLHTARYALEQNREILAVPGSPMDPRSVGANKLIQQGAALIQTAHDVLEAMQAKIAMPLPLQMGIDEPSLKWLSPDPAILSQANKPMDANEQDRQIVIDALTEAPIDQDELLRFTGLPLQTLQLVLLEIELAGRLERHRPNKLSIIHTSSA